MKTLLLTFLLGGFLVAGTVDAAQVTKPKPKKKAKIACSCEDSVKSTSYRSDSSGRLSIYAKNNGPFDKATADSLYMYGRMPYNGIIDTTHHNLSSEQRER